MPNSTHRTIIIILNDTVYANVQIFHLESDCKITVEEFLIYMQWFVEHWNNFSGYIILIFLCFYRSALSTPSLSGLWNLQTEPPEDGGIQPERPMLQIMPSYRVTSSKS